VGKGEDSARGGQGAEGRERWGRMEEEESSKMGQRAVFIDVESGGGPVRAPQQNQPIVALRLESGISRNHVDLE
jgi:hypothetical protein